MTRTSIRIGRVPPTRSISRSWSTRRSFARELRAERADLVQKQGAALRQLELAEPADGRR